MPTPLAGSSIAFDLDGTLVDSAPDLIGALNGLMAQEGLESLPMAAARPMIGRGARHLIVRGFAAAGAPADEARLADLYDRFIAIYRARIADQTAPFAGVKAALDALAAAGAKLAVCTNKPTALSLTLLERLGLIDRFVAVVGPEFAAAPKPDPRHLLGTLDRMGGRPGRAVMVGDTAADAQAARAAGVALALVSFGYTQTPAADLAPDALIDRFADLPEVCERLLVPAKPNRYSREPRGTRDGRVAQRESARFTREKS